MRKVIYLFKKQLSCFPDDFIMVVGDGQDLMFLATDSSNPVPACLNGTKNPVSSGLRNPALMKTEGKTKRKTSIMLE